MWRVVTMWLFVVAVLLFVILEMCLFLCVYCYALFCDYVLFAWSVCHVLVSVGFFGVFVLVSQLFLCCVVSLFCLCV